MLRSVKNFQRDLPFLPEAWEPANPMAVVLEFKPDEAAAPLLCGITVSLHVTSLRR